MIAYAAQQMVGCSSFLSNINRVLITNRVARKTIYTYLTLRRTLIVIAITLNTYNVD